MRFPARPAGGRGPTYQCRDCGRELFELATQFEFQTGAWPNFTEPVSEDAVVIRPRARAALGGYVVHCGGCDRYLGQLYSDGPGRCAERYCVVWAAVTLNAAEVSP